MIICTVEGCDNKNNAQGMCAMHYQRVVRTGTTDAPHIPTAPERFWKKVNKTAGCWNWTAYKNPLGYGAFSSPSGSRQAHRYSYELANGPIPEGMVIDHICHSPSCVNPDHLRACTQKQNMEHRAGAQKNNKSSGVLGVTFYKARNNWIGLVSHNKKSHFVGYFDTLEAAEAAVIAKRLELFTHNDVDRRAA
jgi:hypothetical protein